MIGEYDDQLHWPVKVEVQLQLLNLTGYQHMVGTKNIEGTIENKGSLSIIAIMKYPDIEKLQCTMNDCLKFRIQVTILE